MRAAGVWLTVAWLATAGAARADVVLHDGGVERDAAAAELVRQQAGAAPGLVLPSSVLDGPADAQVRGLALEPCGGGTIDIDAGPRLDAVAELVLSFQLDEALTAVAELDSLLPCSSAPVAGRVLARLAFLRGAALLDQGDADAAATSMADAAAADPEYGGELGFPGDHVALLEQAKAQEPGATLFVWPAPGTKAVLLDGRPAERVDRAGAKVTSGRHLVQLDSGEGLRGAWVIVQEAEAVWVEAGGGKRIWPDLGTTAGAAAALRMLVGAEFGAGDGAVHLLSFQRKGVIAATVAAGGGELTRWEGSAPAKERPERATKPRPTKDKPARTTEAPTDNGAKRLHLLVGGGWHFAEPFHYGLASIDIAVRIVGPLEVGVFARPSFRPYDDGTVAGTVLLVPVGLSVGVRRPGAISPWVAGAGQIAPNRDGDASPVMGGAALIGGLDLAPGDGPFVLRIAGDVGFLGRRFDARALGGVGVRF